MRGDSVRATPPGEASDHDVMFRSHIGLACGK